MTAEEIEAERERYRQLARQRGPLPAHPAHGRGGASTRTRRIPGTSGSSSASDCLLDGIAARLPSWPFYRFRPGGRPL